MRIVVTGSSSGIGRRLVESLLQRDHQVWGLARSDQSDFASTKEGRFIPLRCNVSEWTDVLRATEDITRVTDSIDALITCAGTQGSIGPSIQIDPIEWSQTVRTNLDGTFYAFRACYSLLSKTPRRGKVICFSGGGSTKARPNFSAYAVAKTGVVRLVENLAEELRGSPIDINAIAPGAINTAMTDEVLALGPAAVGESEYRAAIQQKERGGGSLEKALGLITFLLSPESDGISGRLLSAPWDPWPALGGHADTISRSDIYTLRRIVPEDRGLKIT